MDVDFLDVNESSNKKIAFVLILLIISIIFFGYFFVYQKYHFSLKTVELEVMSTLSSDVNDYLKKRVVDTAGYNLDTSEVNPNEIGEYKYKITYNNRTKTGKIKIVDTTPPVYEIQSLKKAKDDEDFFLGDFLTKCEDFSKPCLVTLKNDKDEVKLSTVGTHNLTIVISDLYNNKSETNVSLEVLESLTDPRTTDLEYASSSIEIEDFNGEYYEKLDTAINPLSEEADLKSSELTAIDLEAYVKEKYPDYTLKNSEFIEIYNKSSFIIGYVIRITLDNGEEKQVFITEKINTSTDIS